ncbi:hypothetical protein H5410_050266 [Solanum commersonii]|uniref:Uncharacterized protein n=1 Tax=Solanum commersonii TaxID=4109 RepID=A0A9J5WWB5_SOLCO|nr:hypothetical protein H5410_050266 [Solanum commersonii]
MEELIMNVTSTSSVVAAAPATGEDAATAPAAGKKKEQFDLIFMNPDRSWMYNRNNHGRNGMIPEFAEGSQDRPFTQEENENLWKQSAGEPIRGSVYGYPEEAYQKKKSWYCGSPSSSFDGGDRETISTMESKIAYLNVELAAVAEREKKREEREKRRLRRSDGSDQEGDENDKFDKESEGDEEWATKNCSNLLAVLQQKIDLRRSEFQK